MPTRDCFRKGLKMDHLDENVKGAVVIPPRNKAIPSVDKPYGNPYLFCIRLCRIHRIDLKGNRGINMKIRWTYQGIAMTLLLSFMGGCAGDNARPARFPEAREYVQPQVVRPQRQFTREQAIKPAGKPDRGLKYRVISEKELDRLGDKDPDLSPSLALSILARLNVRARYYVAEDIKEGKPLKVPNDFRAYKHWTPMPTSIPEIMDVPKFIVIAKDLPFLGAYQRGKLAMDTEICIGKSGNATIAGSYRVANKDADHVSRSYPNAYGEPAPMPWALRIYGHVWIHAGDITTGYCSHGCINLPILAAMKLFKWADLGTPVLIVESLPELRTVLEEND